VEYRNSEFYEDDIVFERYITERNKEGNLNDVIEKPLLLELMGDVKDKRVLDLGCGDGQIGFDLLNQGCRHYTGVDGSKKMIDLAKERFLDVKNTDFQKSLLQDWNYPKCKYDLIIARMSLHYLSDLSKVFKIIYGALKKSGAFIFSVEHPFFTYKHYTEDYYQTGEISCKWMGKQVIKNHRKIEDYIIDLQDARFDNMTLRESKPTDWLDEEERKMPLVLFLKGFKR